MRYRPSSKHGSSPALALLLLALAPLHSVCAGSREGWGRGNYVVLLDEDDVQMRRSKQHIDPKTGELWINWIGVRMKQPGERVIDCTLTAFVDQNLDGRPDAGEIRARRANRQGGAKVLFDEFRLPDSPRSAPLRFELEATTTSGTKRAVWDWKSE